MARHMSAPGSGYTAIQIDTGPLYTAPGGVEVGRLDAASAAHTVSDAAGNGWTLVNIVGYVRTNAIVSTRVLFGCGSGIQLSSRCAEM